MAQHTKKKPKPQNRSAPMRRRFHGDKDAGFEWGRWCSDRPKQGVLKANRNLYKKQTAWSRYSKNKGKINIFWFYYNVILI